MTKLSAHFDLSEFRCKGNDGCTTIPPPPELVTLLEAIRSHNGDKPLRILSGYRCERHNDLVGGAFASRHLVGGAVDIAPGIVRERTARQLGAKGIGLAGAWAVHLDVRPGPIVTWRYR